MLLCGVPIVQASVQAGVKWRENGVKQFNSERVRRDMLQAMILFCA